MLSGEKSHTSGLLVAAAVFFTWIASGTTQASFTQPDVITGPEDRGSIWNHRVDGHDTTYAELTLHRDVDDELEPAILPLPIPVIAACSGLFVVMVVRQRIRRTS